MGSADGDPNPHGVGEQRAVQVPDPAAGPLQVVRPPRRQAGPPLNLPDRAQMTATEVADCRHCDTDYFACAESWDSIGLACCTPCQVTYGDTHHLERKVR